MSVIVAPSRFHCWLPLLPWAPKLACWPEALPPTFCTFMTMPGVCSRMTHGSRADGIFSSNSFPKLVPSVLERMSMMGLSPVTVTVSWRLDSSSRPLTSALKPAWMRTSVRMTRLKPVSSNVTA